MGLFRRGEDQIIALIEGPSFTHTGQRVENKGGRGGLLPRTSGGRDIIEIGIEIGIGISMPAAPRRARRPRSRRGGSKRGGDVQMDRATTVDRHLAEAVTKVVNTLHQMYSGIIVRPVSPLEDEDFTLEISISRDLPIDEVLEVCHKECIKVEDEYDLFILPHVVYHAE